MPCRGAGVLVSGLQFPLTGNLGGSQELAKEDHAWGGLGTHPSGLATTPAPIAEMRVSIHAGPPLNTLPINSPSPQRWTPPRAGHSRRATFTASQRGRGEVPQAASTSLCMHQHAPEPSFLPLVPLALGAHSSPSTFSTEYVESRTCPFNYAMEGSASVPVFASS